MLHNININLSITTLFHRKCEDESCGKSYNISLNNFLVLLFHRHERKYCYFLNKMDRNNVLRTYTTNDHSRLRKFLVCKEERKTREERA